METQSHIESDRHAGIVTEKQSLERQLNDIQSIAQIGVWEFRIASEKLVWSEQTCRIMGVDKVRFDGGINTYLSIIHPDDRQKVHAAIEQAKHMLIYPVLEHRVVLPDGEVRHLLLRGFPFNDEEGNTIISGTIQDITGAKQECDALGVMSDYLFNVLENMSDAFCMLDRKWRFIYLNRVAERLLQRQRGELLGKVIWDEFDNLIVSEIETGFRQAMEQNRTTSFERVYVPTNAWHEIRAFPSSEGLAVYFTDISERKRQQELERQSEERFKLVATATTDVIWDWDLKSGQTWWNEGIQRVFGYAPEEFGSCIEAWVGRLHPEEREHVHASFMNAMESGQERWCAEYRFLRKDGSYADVRDRSMFIRDKRGRVVHVIGSMADITEQKQAEIRNRVQASLLDKAHDAITVATVDDRITYWNKGAERLFGWTASEAIGRPKQEFLVVHQKQFDDAHQVFMQQGEWTGELIKWHKNGHMLTVESHWTLVQDDKGRPQSILEIATDITQRKQAEREIEQLAFFDPLTRLPNRRLLLDRLQHALTACRRNSHMGALLFLDLDNFKGLNDTLGHDKGDILLQQAAQRIKVCIPRASDTVARHGGDEFVIVLEDLSNDKEEAAGQAERTAKKILSAFEAPFQLDNQQYHTSTSIGVALFERHMDNVDELMKHADLAMYQAKAAGRNTICFFDPEMQTVIRTRVELESDFRHGLQRHEFCLYYQRQTDDHGHTIGVEALVRWHHPRRGFVSPALFIPLAEETGLILQLGQWVLETACRQIVEWEGDPKTSHLTVAVNVSARQFHQPNFVQQVLDALDRTGADPRKLKLELTESLLVADMERTIEKMNALKAKGISFALDDFGTGYSSLAYLKRLPLDQLKIDASFVKDVIDDANDAAIARIIVGLGNTLGLDVIAEGVETQPQRDFLAQNGCRAYQGYLFSKPAPPGQF